MNKRSTKLFLSDILSSIEKIERYSFGIGFEEFESNDLILDAVIRNIEIIGEAVRNIPAATLALQPGIEWNKVVGLRNIASHAYFGVDASIIWSVVQNRLPAVKNAVLDLLPHLHD